MQELIDVITSPDPAVRHLSLDQVVQKAGLDSLLAQAKALEGFRHDRTNLYERVRALFFLYALHRFHIPAQLARQHAKPGPRIPFPGVQHLLERHFEEAIQAFLLAQSREGPGDEISSALAASYQRLAFQTLADQVRRSVRSVRGNQWMFRMGHPADQPLRVRPELLRRHPDGTYPILRERTPVRMDLSHCGWSDIFFLGMDYPEGARVLNVSIDLGIHGRDAHPQPPVEAYFRVIDEPILRLTSVDLKATADLSHLADVFDFAKDYLGLLKAAVIASGIVPPGMEGSGQQLADLLAQLCGPGRGIELVSRVQDIPKGSRLAVSTSLLAALIAVTMRATGQSSAMTGSLPEADRRVVLARALLGEWLGGSGGGWQDSGGVWPGIKLITGVLAEEGDPEFGISRGRLMPRHQVLSESDCPAKAREALQQSLLLVHGGMAQNVGPILEMVTEKYLLRSQPEWTARQEALGLLQKLLRGLQEGDVARIGEATLQNFQGPIQTIIPWATNHYTDLLIERARAEFERDFWGFWMLGGMSGGGMGFLFHPRRYREAQTRLQEIMSRTRHELRHALPFAMEPVVYDFAVNEHGTRADRLEGPDALLPAGYYVLTVPGLLRQDRTQLSATRRIELDKFGAACRNRPELHGMVQTLFDVLLPRGRTEQRDTPSLTDLLDQHGFDRAQHEQIRNDLRTGRIGLAQNRLRTDTQIEDVPANEVSSMNPEEETGSLRDLGMDLLKTAQVAVISLAGGAASRWTQGAGVVKALNPFCRLGGRHRSFLEIHFAKTRRISQHCGAPIPHVLTTSYLTHEPIADFLSRHPDLEPPGGTLLSRSRNIGLRMIPMVRDLRFAWEEMPQQILDEQQQKVRESARNALVAWAEHAGEAQDYSDNLPLQCLHPVGHWYEVPNLFRNGTLGQLLRRQPSLRYLMIHNIDTLGADMDPVLLGHHARSGAALTFEVINRRLEDRGGGLARVNGRVRLVEGLALPREEEEYKLSFFNTMTTWVDLDRLLEAFVLTRSDLLGAADPSLPESAAQDRISAAIRRMANRVPTYITLKDVKKRWGHGQEDIFPVAQFEKLWSDLTALPEIDSRFVRVTRLRGQQLKEPAQLDGWVRDGSCAHVEKLCAWS